MKARKTLANGFVIRQMQGLLALLLLMVGAQVLAAPSTPGTSAGGTLLQQATPEKNLPEAGQKVPLVVPKQGELPTNTTPLPIKKVVVQGNTIFSDKVLQKVMDHNLQRGGPISLRRLARLARMITDYYHKQGYILTRAYVPAQTLSGQTAKLTVLEATFGKIELNNTSRVNDKRLKSYLSGVTPGTDVRKDPLYRSLLLLEQVPGALIRAQIAPGQARGQSDLVVNAAPAPLVSGRVSIDNAGNKAIGRLRLSGHIALNSPFHSGDRLTVDLLSSGPGLNFIQLGYGMPVNGRGTRVGTKLSWLHYALQGDLSYLDASGDAAVFGLWAEHPLLLNDDSVLNVRLSGDIKQFEDKMSGTFGKKRDINRLVLTFAGSHKVANWGVVSASLSGDFGQLKLKNHASQVYDSFTAHAQGSYAVWRAALAVLQTLNSNNHLYAAIRGQFTSDNLDSSEKLQLGGMNQLPGYKLGTLSGAKGTLTTLAWRHHVGFGWLPAGRWQSEVFADAGHVIINADPWAPGANKASIYDAGLGLRWSSPHYWEVQAEVARYLDRVPAIVGDKPSVQAWLKVTRRF